MIDETWLDAAAAQFRGTDDALRQGMLRFEGEMALGLRQPAASSLYMEPCYVDLPTGRERGRAVTLDFGGTNARAALVELAADGCHVRGEVRRPLRVPGAFDVTRAETAGALFDFLADLVREALARGGARPGGPLPRGRAFSFGTRQRRLGDARLHVGTEGKSSQDDGQVTQPPPRLVEHGEQVFGLATPFVMRSFTLADATEVGTQGDVV